ncbi:unnamed protein product [Toxocara canis]|uniref:Uncharacterized protein n=1 Tax=Toxocara canis TaxID=6265 RepID=A0A3P7HAI8_TOXCA|nr:unnamed protein product [Toxocara canis]
MDLLSNLDGAHELLWFPPTLPANVKLFASITPEASRIGTAIKRLVESEEQYVLVPSLGMGLGLEVIAEWLKSAGRTLTARQWELVTKALTISLDDKVLDDIYQYHLPPVRRIPPLLWSRIRADLPGYLSERAADGVIVLNWYVSERVSKCLKMRFRLKNNRRNLTAALKFDE